MNAIHEFHPHQVELNICGTNGILTLFKVFKYGLNREQLVENYDLGPTSN